jgi:hypothetical protein
VYCTAALEPDPSVAFSEIPGETRHFVERTARFLVVAMRAKGSDITMNSVAAERHPWHMRII